MTSTRLGVLCALALVLGAPTAARAYEGDWKRGDVYYRMVCSVCHKSGQSGAIAPNSMTRAQWEAYLQADRHAKGKDSVRQYLSRPYRDSIKEGNKAAARFIEVADAELFEDVKAFVLRSAKDGDAPAGCR